MDSELKSSPKQVTCTCSTTLLALAISAKIIRLVLALVSRKMLRLQAQN